MLLAGTVAFIATAMVEHSSLGELVARGQARVHALQTQLLIRRTGTLLLDLETGQRGFIITGQVAFLEPYDRSRRELAAAVAALEDKLDDEGPLSPAFKRLQELIHQRMQQVERNVDQRWAVGEEVLKDLPGYVAGKRLMDEIRGELSQLEEAQNQIILQADRGVQAVQERTTALAGLLPGVGCVLIVGAFFALQLERRGRDQAQQALREANATLESEVSRRTEQLSLALSRIQSFAVELDQSVETERRRLAREVHDQIGQIGTATKILVMGLRRKLAPAHEENLTELLELAEQSIHTARHISATLRPPLLDDFGLAAAVQHYAKSIERQGELKVVVEMDGDAALTASQANQLFRIVQEASTNVLRHANAQTLTLTGHQIDAGYQLEIIDDGQGPGSVRVDASGLRNMRERAALAGGRFDFGAAAGGGTRVAVVLPLASEVGEDSESKGD